MFKKFKLKNYRTHLDTEIELKDITLLIGSNNSGKSNLLSGISYFSALVGRANPDRKRVAPDRERDKTLKSNNFFHYKHILSPSHIPISFYCEWENYHGKIVYLIEIYCIDDNNVGCREEIIITTGDTQRKVDHGYENNSSEMLLRTKLKEASFSSVEKELASDFFRSLASIHYYNLQSAFLKGQAFAAHYIHSKAIPTEKKDYSREVSETNKRPNIAGEIGMEGANFQELLKYVKEYEEETYNRFLGYLRRFIKSFTGIIIDRGHTKWQFDMGTSTFPYFEPDKISDGLVKAGAIALLCAMKRPPSMIMLEEVENGINQKNLAEFLSWLSHTSEGGTRTQFILTTHSPSVIREFAHRLDAVYNIHLREKGYKSTITNLNDALKPLVNMGVVEEDGIIEREGKEVVQIKPYHLTELFYNGVLGEL